MEHENPNHLGRRSLIRGGAAAAAALAFGSRLFDPIAAFAAPPAELTMTGTSEHLFRWKTIKSGRRMESFAVDHKNRRLFVATLLANGRDIEVVRTSFFGNPSGAPMIIRNAGHGYAFGVEGIGTESYIWIEDGAAENTPGSGYYAGTRLARWRYEPGVDTGSVGISTGEPFTGNRLMLGGSTNVTCSVDGLYNYGDGKPRLAVRRQGPSGGTRFEIFRLNGFSEPPTLEWAQKPEDDIAGTVQGWTLYGNRIYWLTGDFNEDNIRLKKLRPQEPKTTDYTTALRIQQVEQRVVGVPANHSPHEPEGLAVYEASASEYRLAFGIVQGGSAQVNSIYYRSSTF